MKNLASAEIYVDTRFSMESGSGDGNWFRLADYSNLSEFFIDCASWFSDEENPEYVFSEWGDIPDCLINENWLCPNIFEIRDALQSIETELHDTFFIWCSTYGWDISTEDPYRIVAEFQYSVHSVTVNDDTPEPEDFSPDNYEDEYHSYILAIPGLQTEIFDDNYN